MSRHVTSRHDIPLSNRLSRSPSVPSSSSPSPSPPPFPLPLLALPCHVYMFSSFRGDGEVGAGEVGVESKGAPGSIKPGEQGGWGVCRGGS